MAFKGGNGGSQAVSGEAEETLPTSTKEKETHWLKRAISPFHHKAGTKRAIGDLEGHWKHLAPEPGCDKCSCFQ
eukprot:1142252-Pelagomonas_calceolata.AAC.1